MSERSKKKGAEIIAAECCKASIYIFWSVPLNLNGAQFIVDLESSLMIFNRHENFKYKYGEHHFLYRGYIDSVDKYKTVIWE